MKIKVLLLALGCTMGTLGAYAQKGVDNGTQFGSGEDSVRCITNISLFVPYAKAGNFKDAFDFWKIVYDECPAATKDIYLYGVKIMGWKIAQEKDPAKKKALIDDLMGVYDKRVKYFGNDRRYGKDWIVARKLQDYLAQTGDNADYNQAYTWLKEIVDEKGADTEALGLSLFSFSSMKKMVNDPNFKEQYIQDREISKDRQGESGYIIICMDNLTNNGRCRSEQGYTNKAKREYDRSGDESAGVHSIVKDKKSITETKEGH